MTNLLLVTAAAVTVPIGVAGLLAVLPRRWATPAALVGAVLTAGLALTLSTLVLAQVSQAPVPDWISLDAPAAVLVAVTAIVGLFSMVASPAYLASTSDASRHRRRASTYYAVLFVFWALLLAVPLAGNLGATWLMIEATTAVSALLIGFSRKARALEAGWKYLVLTSLGLGVALLGIALLATHIPGGGLGALSWSTLSTYSGTPRQALVAYVLLLAGLAAKIGWAPVHNWLPDAHSEAPAPVSALLSAALLPTVVLVAWRCQRSLTPVIGGTTARGVLIAFGLGSIAVAIPFLARPLAWKRLMAYSSLEHMGILAVGIGLASPLALAGVAVHVVAHAIAKTVGFHASIPLLAAEPRAATDPVAGVARRQPTLGATLAITIGTLAGVPPSPIFASELLILAGGIQAGQTWPTVAAAALLALAFVALLHTAIETTIGDTSAPPHVAAVPALVARPGRPTGLAGLTIVTALATILLLALAGAAIWLPTTDLAQTLLLSPR